MERWLAVIWEYLGFRPMVLSARGPRIVCIPSSDPEMCGVVQRLYESIPWVTPDRLQAALREIYPQAVVRRRELSDDRCQPGTCSATVERPLTAATWGR